ncbi:dTMP kinase [Alicyclobacillus sp.]|uniref:dTMP kinase n=1 Tax=Alicyclobacillus sp. TaxID=61169 RepID=UPI0025BF0473|nr:dTMP kinase [Alicyclobacillus sp.]
MFITFEGLDGAGKSTQIERLAARLRAAGRPVLLTREPGGTPLGDALRALLLDPARRDMAPAAEALLYAASRAQLLHERVRPALARGEVVVCDRFVDASLAYQGAGLGLGEEAVASINRFATGGLRPDLTFLMDIPVRVSRTRVAGGRSGADRIEQRDDEYFSVVRDAFLRIAAKEPDRVVVLDGTRDAAWLEQEIWAHVEKIL